MSNKKEAKALQSDKGSDLFRTILQTAMDGFWLTDLQGNLLEVNDSYCRMSGYCRDELLDMTIPDLEFNESVMDTRAHMQRLITAGEGRFETRHRRKDGSLFHVEISVQYQPFEGGRMVAFIHDITARKLAQEKQHEAEVRLKSIFEYSPISIWEEDFSLVKNYFNQLRNEGVDDIRTYFSTYPHVVIEIASLVKILEINQTSVRFFEAENKYEIPKNLPLYFINNDSSIAFKEELIALSEGETHFECEIPIVTQNGNEKILLLSLSVVPGYEETLGKVLISFIDITERKKAELLLRDSENRYKYLSGQLEAILDHIPGLVFYKDKKNNFIRVNQYVADAYEKNKKDLEGLNLDALYSHEVALKYYQDDLLVINSGVAMHDIEELWKTPKGTKWVSTSKIPFVGSSGEIEGVIGISLDITERKKADEEINHKNQILSKIVAEKDRFFSIIAHDLRSPFQSLLGFTRMLAEDLPTLTPDEIQLMAKSMNESAGKLHELLENLLEWSVMESGMVVYSPVTIGVRDAIQSVIGLVRESANKKNISVILDIPPVMRVIADPNMFESMIRNLVFNAVKFTPRGGSVTISSKMINGSFAELSVRDTGIGMNRMMIDKLFQHDNQTQRKGTEGEPSTGLGLVIFKGLIEKHGGTIRVESEEGAGSNFIFTLPADQSYPLT